MNDDYLWDGSGTPDPDVAYFEHWAGKLGVEQSRVARRRSRRGRRQSPPRPLVGYGVGMLLGVAAVLLFWWFGPREELESREGSSPDEASAVSADVENERRVEERSEEDAASERGRAEPPVLPGAVEDVDDSSTSVPSDARAPRPRGTRSRSRVGSGSDEPKTDGPRPKDEVVQMLSRHAAGIRTCFREHSSAPKGALVFLRFDITTEGTTEQVRLVRHNFPVFLEGQAVGKCLVREIGTWRWSPGKAAHDEPMVLTNPGPGPGSTGE